MSQAQWLFNPTATQPFPSMARLARSTPGRSMPQAIPLPDPVCRPARRLTLLTRWSIPPGNTCSHWDTTGVVHIFTVGANAALSQIGTSESAGSGADRIAIDPSGRFVIVVQASPDQLTVFSFDPASAAMKKLPGTNPVGKLPVRIATVSE